MSKISNKFIKKYKIKTIQKNKKKKIDNNKNLKKAIEKFKQGN